MWLGPAQWGCLTGQVHPGVRPQPWQPTWPRFLAFLQPQPASGWGGPAASGPDGTVGLAPSLRPARGVRRVWPCALPLQSSAVSGPRASAEPWPTVVPRQGWSPPGQWGGWQHQPLPIPPRADRPRHPLRPFRVIFRSKASPAGAVNAGAQGGGSDIPPKRPGWDTLRGSVSLDPGLWG